MKQEKQDKIQMVCSKCGYECDTRSRLQLVSCPSCGTKNKIEANIPKEVKKK